MAPHYSHNHKRRTQNASRHFPLKLPTLINFLPGLTSCLRMEVDRCHLRRFSVLTSSQRSLQILSSWQSTWWMPPLTLVFTNCHRLWSASRVFHSSNGGVVRKRHAMEKSTSCSYEKDMLRPASMNAWTCCIVTFNRYVVKRARVLYVLASFPFGDLQPINFFSAMA